MSNGLFDNDILYGNHGGGDTITALREENEYWKNKCRKLEAIIAKQAEALGKLEKYVAHNGDTWVQDTARECIKEVERMREGE